jgi:hypothetical protein
VLDGDRIGCTVCLIEDEFLNSLHSFLRRRALIPKVQFGLLILRRRR